MTPTPPINSPATHASTTASTTLPTTAPTTAPAMSDENAGVIAAQLGFWAAIALVGVWIARRFAWRAERLPVETRTATRGDALPLWIGAAVMLAVQILFGADLLRRVQGHFIGSPLADEVAMIGLCTMYLAGFVAVAVVHYVYGWRQLAYVGLSRSLTGNDVRLGATAALVAIPVTNVALLLTQILWASLQYQHDSVHQLLQVMGRDRASPIVLGLTVLVAVVLAPISEELLFRGHIQSAIARLVPRHRWVSIAITSLLFAGVHAPWMIPPIFVLSLMLGYARQRTGSLWVSIMMHMAFNATSTAYFLLVRGA